MLHATAGNAAGWERSMRPQTRREDERESKGVVSQGVAAGCSPSRALAGNQAVLRLRLLAKPGDDSNVIGLQVRSSQISSRSSQIATCRVHCASRGSYRGLVTSACKNARRLMPMPRRSNANCDACGSPD